MSLRFPQGPPSLRRVSHSHSRGWSEPTYRRKVLLTRTYEHLPILLKNGFRSKAIRAVRPGRSFGAGFVSRGRNGKIGLPCGPHYLLKVRCIVRLTTKRNSKKIAIRVFKVTPLKLISS